MVFLDTPGYFQPKNKLGEYMADVVRASIADVDVVVLVIDITRGTEPQRSEIEMIEAIKRENLPVILVINKIDARPKEKILPAIDAYRGLYDFIAVIPVSAKTQEGVDELLGEIRVKMPEGPWFFDSDELTDQTERQIAADMIREKLLGALSDEVPHGTAVEVILMEDQQDGCLHISANIYCEKESHKGIIIGKGGAMLKKIGSLARLSLEEFFDTKVYLQLWVKVKEDWRNRESDLRNFGFH
jgi:GTP-binding protein Era